MNEGVPPTSKQIVRTAGRALRAGLAGLLSIAWVPPVALLVAWLAGFAVPDDPGIPFADERRFALQLQFLFYGLIAGYILGFVFSWPLLRGLKVRPVAPVVLGSGAVMLGSWAMAISEVPWWPLQFAAFGAIPVYAFTAAVTTPDVGWVARAVVAVASLACGVGVVQLLQMVVGLR